MHKNSRASFAIVLQALTAYHDKNIKKKKKSDTINRRKNKIKMKEKS